MCCFLVLLIPCHGNAARRGNAAMRGTLHSEDTQPPLACEQVVRVQAPASTVIAWELATVCWLAGWPAGWPAGRIAGSDHTYRGNLRSRLRVSVTARRMIPWTWECWEAGTLRKRRRALAPKNREPIPDPEHWTRNHKTQIPDPKSKPNHDGDSLGNEVSRRRYMGQSKLGV